LHLKNEANKQTIFPFSFFVKKQQGASRFPEWQTTILKFEKRFTTVPPFDEGAS
jgi:hypothetical protein